MSGLRLERSQSDWSTTQESQDDRVEGLGLTRRTRSERSLGSLPVIGWREWVGLPELGIPAIKVKVDTGARTSSLHAFDLVEVVRDDVVYVRFSIHPEQRSSHPTVSVELPLTARRRVRDSSGQTELRPIVETTIALHGQAWPIELTLTRRDAMGFRMLLGRQAIRHRFVVDSGSSYYAGKRKKRKRPAATKRKKR